MEIARKFLDYRIFSDDALSTKRAALTHALKDVLGVVVEDTTVRLDVLSRISEDCERLLDMTLDGVPVDDFEWLKIAKSSHVAFRASEFAEGVPDYAEGSESFVRAMQGVLSALVLPELSENCEIVSESRALAAALDKEWPGSPLGEIMSAIVDNFVSKLNVYGMETECGSGVGMDGFCLMVDMVECAKKVVAGYDHCRRVRTLFECDQYVRACMRIIDLDNELSRILTGDGVRDRAIEDSDCVHDVVVPADGVVQVTSEEDLREELADDGTLRMLVQMVFGTTDPSELVAIRSRDDPSDILKRTQALAIVRAMCVQTRKNLQTTARGLLVSQQI